MVPSTACGKCLMLTVWSPCPSPEVMGTLKKCLYHLHWKSQSHLIWNLCSSKTHLSYASRLMTSCVVPKSCLACSRRPMSPLDLLLPAAQRTSPKSWAAKSCLAVSCVLAHTPRTEGAILIPLLSEHMIEAQGIHQAECVGKSEFKVV